MNKRRILLYVLLICVPIVGILFNVFYLHSAIEEAYKGHADSFLRFVIRILYPRFEIERTRFDLPFFLTKADQVVYRSCFVYGILLVLLYLSKKRKGFSKTMYRVFQAETTYHSIDLLRYLFFGYSIYLSLELCHDLIMLQPMKVFYKPILWLRIIPIPFPHPAMVVVLACVWILLQLFILFNRRIILCSFLSLVILLLVQCWVFGFEKFDHGYVTFTYAFVLMPFLFDEQKNSSSPVFHSWSLALIRISIALVYFLSGLEKIFISKCSWLNPEHLNGYLSLHETSLSKIIIQYDSLCILIGGFTLLFQLSFVLILFYPKHAWLWIVSGILFHTGTLVVMGIGHPLNPWLAVYIFYIDWTRPYTFLSARFKKPILASS